MPERARRRASWRLVEAGIRVGQCIATSCACCSHFSGLLLMMMRSLCNCAGDRSSSLPQASVLCSSGRSRGRRRRSDHLSGKCLAGRTRSCGCTIAVIIAIPVPRRQQRLVRRSDIQTVGRPAAAATAIALGTSLGLLDARPPLLTMQQPQSSAVRLGPPMSWRPTGRNGRAGSCIATAAVGPAPRLRSFRLSRK